MSDPFFKQLLKRQQLEKTIPKCGEQWTTRRQSHYDKNTVEIHTCKRIYDHHSNHVCPCGVTRKRRPQC